MDFPALTIATLEDLQEGLRIRPLAPVSGESFQLFPLHDPFGLRLAIIPLFWMQHDGDLQGLGTAFAADPWGTFLTADHVIEIARQRSRALKQVGGNFHSTAPDDEGIMGVLGFGIAFGEVALPQTAVVRMKGARTPVIPGNNPLLQLQGRPDFRPIDLAELSMTKPGQAIHNLPMRRLAPLPKIGDVVVAVGFPDVETFAGSEQEARNVISEGMKVAYGRVKDIQLVGRDASNPTPVFAVDANWPSGMSGGPVFNADGEVIGLVSRSYVPDNPSETGEAWATWLGILGHNPTYAPTLDPSNPSWRRGWAVFDANEDIVAVFPTEAAARAEHPTAAVAYVSWQLGSQNYMREDPHGT